jgi:hypothetical protein
MNGTESQSSNVNLVNISQTELNSNVLELPEGIPAPPEPIKKTLAELLIEKLELMDELEEMGGDITDNPLGQLWDNNEMALAEKIDNYGRVVKGLEAKKAVLKAEIDSVRDSLSKKVSAIENHIDRIKERMYSYCPVEDGEKKPLRGNIYSFLPRISLKKTIPDIEKVEFKHRTITLDIKGANLLAAFKELKTTQNKFFKLINPESVKERALLADLPGIPGKGKNAEPTLHPAIVVASKTTTQLR